MSTGELTAEIVTGVFAELTKLHEADQLTGTALRDPGFDRRFRTERVAELDAEIAAVLHVRDWCMDPVHQKELKKALHSKRWVMPDAEVSWFLLKLAQRLHDPVRERATLSGRRPQATASLAELQQTLSEYGLVYESTQLYMHRLVVLPHYSGSHKRFVRGNIRLLGGRKQVEDILQRLADKLWALLAETNWQDAGPAQLPAGDKAFGQEWGKSSSTMLARRHELVRLGVGEHRRLTVDADGEVRYEPL
ncbi:hypothetical protein AB0L70_27740 [Kribbella sp. NPDC051952]|uniref:hypothetical protein n=1 Tax=Kribbella sp. NPDC051952 TaxID=3154851 RepID=UPI003422319C